jgi:hypothetical protein
MLSSPLLLGCDTSQLDQFQIDFLSNDEVLGVNQDALGKQAYRTSQDGPLEVWSKPLSDGTIAAGLFTRSVERAKVTACSRCDLWQRRDLGPRGCIRRRSSVAWSCAG